MILIPHFACCLRPFWIRHGAFDFSFTEVHVVPFLSKGADDAKSENIIALYIWNGFPSKQI